MPIALLLQKPSALLPTLLAATKALTPWVDIARAEMVLLARARGAFLVSWFGRSIPRDGPYVGIAIGNRAELDARLREVVLAGSPTAGAASVTTPISALAGMIGGTLLSPVGQIAGISLQVQFGGFGITTIALALAALAGLAFRVAALAAAGLVVGAPVALAAFPERVDGVMAVAASAARAMNAATTLFGLLLAPRSEVRNPLLRSTLRFGDRLGAFAAQLLGAVAFVIDQIGPRLIPTARTLVAIRQAVATTADALGAAVETLLTDLNRITDGDLAIAPFFARLAAVVREVVANMAESIGNGIDLAAITIMRGIDELSAGVEIYRGDAQRYLHKVFTEHPTVKMVLDLVAIIEDKTKGSAKPKRPGFTDILLPKVELPDPARILKQLAAQPIPPLTWKAIEQESLRRPGPAGLAPGALARLMLELRARMAVAGMAHRPSIFKAERASQREALTQNRAELVKLTDEMSLLVGSFLTPALWDRLAPRLAPSVDAFTALVYRDIPAPPPAERPLPVRRPDAPVPVRPLIRTLRLRVPGATPDEVRALRDRLVQRLQVQPYAVAPVTWGR